MAEEVVTEKPVQEPPIDLSPERVTKLIKEQATFEELDTLSKVEDGVVGPTAREELKARRPKTKPSTIMFMGKPVKTPIQFPLERVKPQLETSPPLTGELLIGMPTQSNEEFTTILDSVVEQANIEEEGIRNEQALQIVNNETLSPKEKADAVKALPPADKHTPGSLFAKKFNIVEEIDQFFVANDVDIKIKKESNQNAQMAILGNEKGMLWSEYMTAPRQEAGIIYNELLDELFGRKDITEGVHQELKHQIPQSYQDAWDEGEGAILRALIFQDPRPIADVEQVDWKEVWRELMDMDGDKVSDQFVRSMGAQYGPYWKWRWGTFFAREVGVDAAALWYASTIRGVKNIVFPGKAASLSARARAVGVRASIVSVAGTATEGIIQSVIDGGETFDLGSEMLYRFGGELIGEAAMKALMVGGKFVGKVGVRVVDVLSFGAISKARKGAAAANAVERKMLTKDELTRIDKVMFPEGSTMQTVWVASIRGEAKEYKRIAGEVAAGIADPAVLKEKRAQFSQLTGIPEQTLELWFAVSPKIFTKKVLREIGGDDLANLSDLTNIGKSEEVFKLKKSIETTREIVTDLARQDSEKTSQIVAHNLLGKQLGATGDQRLKVLRSERRVIRKDMKEQAALLSDGEALLVKIEKRGPTTTGNQLADNVLQTTDQSISAVGFRVFGEVHSRQNAVQDMVVSYISKGDKFQFRDPIRHTNTLTKTQRFRQALRVGEPDTYPNPGITKDYFDLFNKGAALSKEWEKVIMRSLDGIGNNGQQRISRALEEGNNAEKVWTPDQLLAQYPGITLKEIDAYYAVRKALDFAHVVNDDIMVRKFTEQGVKKHQGEPVNVIRKHKELSQDEIDAGFVMVRPLVDTSSKPKPELVKVKEAELEELTSVMKAHIGYLPRVYKDAKYTVSVINTKTGEVSRIAALPRQTQAIAKARARQEANNPNEVVVYHKWDDNTGNLRISVPKASIQVYDITDEVGTTQLKEAIKNSDIEGADKIVAYFNRLDNGDARNRFTGARQERPIPGAELAPSFQAISDYFLATARNQSLGYWRNVHVDSFKEQYKAVLKSGLHWSDPNAIPKSATVARVEGMGAFLSDNHLDLMLQDARLMQRAMKRAVFGMTAHERFISNWMDTKIASLANSDSIVKRAGARLLETSKFDAFGYLRGTAAYSKLMLGNVAQVVVQASQIAATVGAHPIHATAAAGELMEVTLAALARQVNPDLPLPKHMEQTYNALRLSGFLADVRTSDLANFAKTRGNPVPAGVGKSVQFGKDTLRLISTGPFTLGEATNRAMAFLTIRREATALAKQGKLKGLDGKTFTGKIDDEEFLRVVANKAKNLSFNMGKPGQLEALSGAGSVLFQFKQVGFKFVNMFETKELSPREKAGAAIMMLGMWGPGAIPFLPDLLGAGDAAVRILSDNPNNTEFFTQNILQLREVQNTLVDLATMATPEELDAFGIDREFFKNLSSRGAVTALSKGNLAITNRVALGKFFMDSIEDASWEDSVVSVGVIIDIFDAAEKSGVLNVANVYTYLNALALYSGEQAGAIPEGSYNDFIEKLRFANEDLGLIGTVITAERNEDQTDVIVQIASETGQALSYIGQLGRFMQGQIDLERAENTPEGIETTAPFAKTSGGTPLVPLDRITLPQHIFGLTPGNEIEALNRIELENLYSRRLNDWVNKQVDDFNGTRDKKKRIRIVQSTLEDLSKLQGTLHAWEKEGILETGWLKKQMQKFYGSISNRDLPKEFQTLRE